MNPIEDKLPSQWDELKNLVRRQWRKVTLEDLVQLSGTSEALANILQRRYGYGSAHARIEIKDWLLKQNSQATHPVE